jgi:hypothetical protein
MRWRHGGCTDDFAALLNQRLAEQPRLDTLDRVPLGAMGDTAPAALGGDTATTGGGLTSRVVAADHVGMSGWRKARGRDALSSMTGRGLPAKA